MHQHAYNFASALAQYYSHSTDELYAHSPSPAPAEAIRLLETLLQYGCPPGSEQAAVTIILDNIDLIEQHFAGADADFLQDLLITLTDEAAGYFDDTESALHTIVSDTTRTDAEPLERIGAFPEAEVPADTRRIAGIVTGRHDTHEVILESTQAGVRQLCDALSACSSLSERNVATWSAPKCVQRHLECFHSVHDLISMMQNCLAPYPNVQTERLEPTTGPACQKLACIRRIFGQRGLTLFVGTFPWDFAEKDRLDWVRRGYDLCSEQYFAWAGHEELRGALRRLRRALALTVRSQEKVLIELELRSFQEAASHGELHEAVNALNNIVAAALSQLHKGVAEDVALALHSQLGELVAATVRANVPISESLALAVDMNALDVSLQCAEQYASTEAVGLVAAMSARNPRWFVERLIADAQLVSELKARSVIRSHTLGDFIGSTASTIITNGRAEDLRWTPDSVGFSVSGRQDTAVFECGVMRVEHTASGRWCLLEPWDGNERTPGRVMLRSELMNGRELVQGSGILE